jgi:ribosomal protein S18 acetylase RimI-like enzyme
MMQAALTQQMTEIAFNSRPDAANSLIVHALRPEHRTEVLSFLSDRPIHTVFMAGFIRDNGLVSPLNRGTFYGCRDCDGRLEGVSLIGHFTFVETRSERALSAFARMTQVCPSAHLILGEDDKVERFWSYFDKEARNPRRVSRQVLFEQRAAKEFFEPVKGLREATPNDLPRLLPVYAQMVAEESGMNPLETDSAGFRQRWLRRIEQRRVWLWTEDGTLLFCASIVSETADVIYLEGIHVNPDARGRGYGARCLSQLSRRLLERAKTLCLFANEQNAQGRAFYEKIGFEAHCYYDTIFLHPRNQKTSPASEQNEQRTS